MITQITLSESIQYLNLPENPVASELDAGNLHRFADLIHQHTTFIKTDPIYLVDGIPLAYNKNLNTIYLPFYYYMSQPCIPYSKDDLPKIEKAISHLSQYFKGSYYIDEGVFLRGSEHLTYESEVATAFKTKEEYIASLSSSRRHRSKRSLKHKDKEIMRTEDQRLDFYIEAVKKFEDPDEALIQNLWGLAIKDRPVYWVDTENCCASFVDRDIGLHVHGKSLRERLFLTFCSVQPTSFGTALLYTYVLDTIESQEWDVLNPTITINPTSTDTAYSMYKTSICNGKVLPSLLGIN